MKISADYTKVPSTSLLYDYEQLLDHAGVYRIWDNLSNQVNPWNIIVSIGDSLTALTIKNIQTSTGQETAVMTLTKGAYPGALFCLTNEPVALYFNRGVGQ